VGKELERATRTASRVVAERPLVVKFAEIYGGLKAPSCLVAVDVVGIGTTGLLVIDPRLFFYIYEVLLGGDGQSVDVIDENVTLLNQRGFTPAEERMLRQIVELVSEAQRVGWQDIIGVRLKFVRAQVDPRHAAIMSPSELVLESPLTVEIGGI
jgi:flagellar motor switch protein FliM